RADTTARHFILKGCLISDNLIVQKKHQSSKDNSAKNSRQDTGASDHQVFPEHHNGNLFLSHSENIMKADLFSALLDQEAVCVEKKYTREDCNNDCTKSENASHAARPRHFFNSGIVHDDRHIEKQHDRDDAGYQKRKIRPFVFLQVGECKPDVNRFKHAAHLLWSVPSRCLKSSGTALHFSYCPGKSDGRLRHL